MSPDAFDDLDRALASGLSALAPEVLDGDDTLVSLRPGFERARTRARIVKAGSGLLALVAIGTAATLVAPTATRTHVSVSSPSTATPTTGRPNRSSTTSAPSTTIPAKTSDVTPTSVISPRTGKTGNPSTPGSVPVFVPTTLPGGDHGGGTGSGGGPSSSTTVPPAGEVHTFSSPAGSITVVFAHGEVRLLRVSLVRGYEDEIRDGGPAHVEVRFTRLHDGTQSRIELRVENGQLVRLDHSND